MATIDSALGQLLAVLKNVNSRLENLESKAGITGSRPVAVSSPSQPAPAPVQSSPALNDFDAIVSQHLAEVVKIGKEIGGDIAQQVENAENAFRAERDLLAVAVSCKKPSPEVFQTLLKPIADILVAAQSKADKRLPDFNSLAAISEGLQALAWVCTELPVPHIKEAADQSTFYANKVRVEFKEKSKPRVDLVNKLRDLLETLQGYAKTHHTTGLVWNPKGMDAEQFKKPGAPPAPPPRATKAPSTPPAAGPQAGSAKSSLFAELTAKQEGVTQGLSHVTADMKTKNRPKEEEQSRVVSQPTKTAAPKPAAAKPAAPPVKELRGNRWHIENFVNAQETPIVLEGVEQREVVYIYNCVNSTIQIKGKVNSISIDKCKKSGVVFDKVMASCEIVNCDSVQVQVQEECPTVQIDSCSGVQLFLTEENRANTTIVSSKSAEMNIAVLANDDLVETPIPEQYVTTFKGGQWVTAPNKHLG